MRYPKLVCFLSDFGQDSIYVSQVKGAILKICPQARILDLTHNIGPQQIIEASFLLKNAYSFFPEGCVFLCVIDPGVGTSRKIIFAQTLKYFFIAPDNGLLYETLKIQKIVKIISVENSRYFLKDVSSTFHGRDIFAPVVAHFLNLKNIDVFGKKISFKDLKGLNIPQPVIGPHAIEAKILHIDRFGNLVTNLCRRDFLRFMKNRRFVGYLRGRKITRYCTHYAPEEKRPFFIIGSFSALEVSLSRGSAASYFGARIQDTLRIKLI